jgi:hypothetical protein
MNRFRKRDILPMGLALLAAAAWAGDQEVPLEQSPLIQPPGKGDIEAVITPADRIEEITAVHRPTGKVYRPESWDAKTGRVVFKSLPGDRTYDLQVLTGQGRRVEGIDLEFTDARLLRMARRGRRLRNLPARPGRPFTAADAREVARFVRKQDDFMDWGRTLYVHGHGRYATALVELMRTRGFYAGGGQVIWRIELWYFENQGAGWMRLANQENVLRRERLSPKQWRLIDVAYHPELSVFVDAKGQSEPVVFELPAKTDPRRGRPAGTKPKLSSEPVLLGIDSPDADQPDSTESSGP